MLPTMLVTEPTHWVPATQPSLTSVLSMGWLQSPPDRFTGRKYRWISQTDPGFFKNLVTENLPVTERSAAPTIPVLTAGPLVTEFTGYRENLPVTERSAAPTIPVLTAGPLVTEFTSYRENLSVTVRSAAPTIPVLTAGSLVTEFSGYREICCSHHSSADSRLTGYREISCSHGQKAT